MKKVMCVGTWPEDNYKDFEVFEVRENESEGDAILRAEKAYSSEDEFYILEQNA